MFKILKFPLETAGTYLQHIQNRLRADILMKDVGTEWNATIFLSYLECDELLDEIERIDKQGLLGDRLDRWVRCEDGRWAKWWAIPAEERDEVVTGMYNKRPSDIGFDSVFGV